MILLKDFNKVMPLLKQGFYVKWQNSNELDGWYSYETFADRYDFSQIQVIKCQKHFYYNSDDFDLDLLLKKLKI